MMYPYFSSIISFVMKNTIICLTVASFCALISCSNNTSSNDEAQLQGKEACLEDILEFTSEADLIKEYGKESVTYDTIWGYEGYFTMGTYLTVDTLAHIEIVWTDSASRKGLISATLVSDADYYATTIAPGKWKSCTGVYVGMSTDDLQKLNGRPFKFSGFGWDYGGGVMGWESGTLDGKGISVQLSEGGSADLPENEINQVLGDVTVMSDNPVLKKLNPRVWSISVAKVQ